MHKQHSFFGKNNIKYVNQILSFDYYNKNYYFNTDFHSIAYVFVFSIIPVYIGICLFTSMSRVKYKKSIRNAKALFLVSIDVYYNGSAEGHEYPVL